MLERLQKIMANAGVASRRASEELILAGRVTVNGQVVTELGTKADIRRDRIAVDGKLIEIGAGRIYLKLNKPLGVLSSVSDPHGRRTVVDLVSVPGRIYPVGRLDYDSEGLMLLTNDGELTARLTHARYGQLKTYLALVRGTPSNEALAALIEGVELEDGLAQALEAASVSGLPSSAPGMNLPLPPGMSWVEITLDEGRKHEVRHLLQAVGHPVERLIRIRMGPIILDDLRPGEARRLSPSELRALEQAHLKSPGDGTEKPTRPGAAARGGARRGGERRGGERSKRPGAPARGGTERQPAAGPRRPGAPARGGTERQPAAGPRRPGAPARGGTGRKPTGAPARGSAGRKPASAGRPAGNATRQRRRP